MRFPCRLGRRNGQPMVRLGHDVCRTQPDTGGNGTRRSTFSPSMRSATVMGPCVDSSHDRSVPIAGHLTFAKSISIWAQESKGLSEAEVLMSEADSAPPPSI